MNKCENLTTIFQEIETIDPKLKIKGTNIYLKPFFLNYSFLTNFVPIGISIYIITNQNDQILNLVSCFFILVMIIVIINQLKYYNLIQINCENKKIIIYPNKIWNLFKKIKTIEFEEINKITVVSNEYTSGFFAAYRRYFIILILKDTDEIKLISSNKHETALKITEKISLILK